MPVELDLPQAKPWYKSLTIQGVILSLFGALMPMLGIDLPPEQLASLGNTLGINVNPDTTHFMVTAIGALMSIFGRVRARVPLSARASTCVSTFLIVGLALSLSACGAVSWNKQNYSGITDAEVETGIEPTSGKPYIKKARFTDGKEKQKVALSIKSPEGWEISYSADGVKSFDGQAVRGAVEKAVSQNIADVTPGVVSAIADTATKILVPIP